MALSHCINILYKCVADLTGEMSLLFVDFN